MKVGGDMSLMENASLADKGILDREVIFCGCARHKILNSITKNAQQSVRLIFFTPTNQESLDSVLILILVLYHTSLSARLYL